MKKLLLSAVIAAVPFSFALAGDKAADAKADAASAPKAAAGAPVAVFPDWDIRKAGESVDLTGKKPAGAEK